MTDIVIFRVTRNIYLTKVVLDISELVMLTIVTLNIVKIDVAVNL